MLLQLYAADEDELSDQDSQKEDGKKDSKKNAFLEFEKFKEGDEEQKLNFNLESSKSMKQIVKLIKLARKIPTSKDFLQFYKSEDQDPLEEVEIH